MKRIISLILVFALMLSMASCGAKPQVETDPVAIATEAVAAATTAATETSANPAGTEQITETAAVDANQVPEETFPPYEIPDYNGLNDPVLLQNMEDSVYAGLAEAFETEDYIIENVEAVYVSKEYIEELNYNSQMNVFFGYTLAELDEQFQGTRYVFTLGDDGQTAVEPFEEYDDTYEQVLKNVAIGSGVILICATVSVVTAGAGLTTVSVVLAASAKTATTAALSGGALGGLIAGIIEGIRTGDWDAAMKAAALAGSEGFKWGAISGALAGGASELRLVTKADDVANIADDAANAVDDVANAADDVANVTDDILNNADEVAKGSVEIADDLPEWRKAELRALNEQGGYDQLTFQDGKLVPHGTQGGTRPDVVRMIDDHIEAVEVKYYDLESPGSRSTLYRELLREVTDRVAHLPQGSTQRIILDVTDRGFDAKTVQMVVDHILEILDDVYPNIPIDVVGLL